MRSFRICWWLDLVKQLDGTDNFPNDVKKDASKSDKLKYELCRQFIKYLLKHKMTQKELAEEIDIQPARMNEIVKYRIDLFTVDRLLNYAERLKLNLKITVG